jgi:hypothetical protein
MRILRLSSMLLVLTLTAGSVAATVVNPPSFESLVAQAGEIFLGQVTEQSARWVNRGGKRLIVTDVTFRTSQILKGSPGTLRTLTFLGGAIGEERIEVPGMPSFMVGDRDVIFVRGGSPSLVPIVALYHGRFRVVTGPGGAGEFVANNARLPLVSTTTYYAPAQLRATDRPLRLADFLDAIRTLAAKR